jgi:hypothetical protein
MIDAKNSLLTTTSLKPDGGSAFIRPTEMERRHGRLMRAPDHPAADPAPTPAPPPPPADPAPADPAPSDPPADPADPGDASLMGGIGGDPADPADPADPPADPDDKPADPAPEVPEKYELTAPEGLEINDEVLAEIDPIFRELGLSNDAANKIMPLAGKFMERITAAQAQQHADLAADWAKEAKADKRIGGKNWGETETFVAKAFDTAAAGLGKDGAKQVGDFRELLNATGLGNHPVMIRMFRFYGERISEDTNFPRTGEGAAIKQSREEVLYPNDVPSKEGAK